ncbi:MAG: ABC transporter permease [Lachnospirales bacterium]
MNILHKVTAKSLRKNRTRTIVTIIGIILSAAMVTAVASLVVSFQSYLFRTGQWEMGNWYTGLIGASAENLETMRQDSQVDTMYEAQILGYAETESSNPDKPYLYVLGVKEDFMQNMAVHLVSGRLPENSSEILLPLHLTTNGEVSYQIGDTWTLELGRRDIEGYGLSQYNPYVQEEESFVGEYSRTYTIVGTYERPEFEDYSAPGYTALVYWDDTAPVTSYEVYLTTYQPGNAYLYPNENMACSAVYNDTLLMFSGASSYSSYYTVLYGLAAVIIFLILFGSISLIYNAFSISVSDRTRQFGLLSSIGATKRQLRSSVLYEALLVGGIGVPLGILCGLLGIGVTLFFIGDYFSGILFGSDANSEITLHLVVSWQSILISFVIGMVTVLISAWIPAKRATRVSAVEAVRSSQDIKISCKEVKVNRLNYVFFKLEGLLAKKYFKRDRKKYRATVVSLFMSVVLFISSSAYILYLTGTVGAVMEVTDYDLRYYVSENTDEEKVFTLLSAVEGVQNAAMVSNCYGGTMEIDPSYVSADYQEMVGEDDEGQVYLPTAYILFVNDENFNQYLESVGEDPAYYTDPEHPRALLYDRVSVFYEEKIQNMRILTEYPREMTLDYTRILDYESGYEEDPGQITVEIGSYQETLPFGANDYSNTCLLLYPRSQFSALFAGHPYLVDSGYTSLYFQAEDHEKVYEDMRNILLQNQMEAYQLSDERASQETENNTILVINVLSYGFVILIALIAVANVFNTISTNVALRRKDFAMLRSVGMTQKGFDRMMCYECLMYGTKALCWGLPVSILISFWLYLIVNNGWETGFLFPWHAVIIAVVGVFLVVFTTMMYAIRKIKKENLVDALKTDIQ